MSNSGRHDPSKTSVGAADAAAGPDARDANAGQSKPTFGRAIAENIECLAIAIVMALILKFFLLEAYKIPTGSMQPTIMGLDEPKVTIFDRVLVNKMVYFLREPKRFEVVVFKMPLSQRQNYIKRLIGLPGEKVRIRDGDIFVTPPGKDLSEEEIARKPDRVWRSVRKRVIPADPDDYDLSQLLRAEGDSDDDVRISDSFFVLDPQRGSAAAMTQRDIRDAYYHGYPPSLLEALGIKDFNWKRHHSVSDLQLVATITADSEAETVRLQLRGTSYVHTAEFDCGGGDARIWSEPRREDASEVLADTQWTGEGLGLAHDNATEISFRNVDDELVLKVDDDEVVRLPYRTQPSTRNERAHVLIGTEGMGEVRVEGFEVYRDIHYTSAGPGSGSQRTYDVPDDAYFVMGDNTQSSYDCRQWSMGVYELSSGQRISGNLLKTDSRDANPRHLGNGVVQFRNVWGENYEFRRSQAKGPVEVPYNYVPEDFLLGKAIAVFWPLPPFSPTWRLRLVR